MLLVIQVEQLFGLLLSRSVNVYVSGMRLCTHWCSFILDFLSERECKHGPPAKISPSLSHPHGTVSL